MTYFSLRKHAVEPEPEVAEETPEVVEEDAEEEPKEQPAKQYGPLLTGLFGPGRWLAARFGMSTAWGVHVVAVWAVAYYRGWIAAGVLMAWLLAVLTFVPREHLDRWSGRIEKRDTPPPAEAPQPAVGDGGRDRIIALLYHLLGDAPGLHLRTVLAYLQEHGQWEGREVADLRQHLEALGIPVRPKVKVGGTPTRGVLKADLDALSPTAETAESPAPSPAV